MLCDDPFVHRESTDYNSLFNRCNPPFKTMENLEKENNNLEAIESDEEFYGKEPELFETFIKNTEIHNLNNTEEYLLNDCFTRSPWTDLDKEQLNITIDFAFRFI